MRCWTLFSCKHCLESDFRWTYCQRFATKLLSPVLLITQCDLSLVGPVWRLTPVWEVISSFSQSVQTPLEKKEKKPTFFRHWSSHHITSQLAATSPNFISASLTAAAGVTDSTLSVRLDWQLSALGINKMNGVGRRVRWRRLMMVNGVGSAKDCRLELDGKLLLSAGSGSLWSTASTPSAMRRTNWSGP